jgi:hypothetical protein
MAKIVWFKRYGKKWKKRKQYPKSIRRIPLLCGLWRLWRDLNGKL